MDRLELVVQECLTELDRRYDGTFHYYHSRKHTAMVIESVARLAKLAGCWDIELEVLTLAASGHDLEQEKGPGKNERESGRLIGEIMKRHGFSGDEIGFVCSLISGTATTWVRGVMHQEAESMGLLAQLLADADLYALGADEEDFVDMAYRTMAELAKKPIEKFSQAELHEGWRKQVKFMTGRRYLTMEAKSLFGEQMQRNLVFAKRMAGE